jgi:glycosyltransferase involved in cell wall biosynthesis
LSLDPDGVRTITCPIARVEPLPPPDGPPRVVFAGRFEARKGPDVLLRAIPRLLERVPDTRVVLRGTDTGAVNGDSYSGGLRRMITELAIAGVTEIVDRWDSDSVREELTRATVCAVPSRWESFGYVAAEAAALGRPVVASRIPAFEDIVEDGVTGRLVPAEDSVSLSDALGDLLSAPSTARRMGAAAADEIAERCDPDGVATSTLEAYELAITRWRGRKG